MSSPAIERAARPASAAAAARLAVPLSLAAALGGIGLLLAAVALYLLGYNDSTFRTGNNLVPFAVFSGVGLILVSGAGITCFAPERLKPPPAAIGIVALSLASLAAVALYIRQEGKVISLPVDLVMGSESQFVDHIIRFRAGQPQYTPGEDANTSAYTPGAPLLTYMIAKAAGYPESIAAYRLTQQIYLLAAALFGAFAARRLFRVCAPRSRLANVWLLFWIPFLYLVANNPFTNVYTHTLYSDGLALAVNAAAFWLLIQHLASRDDRWLIAMAILPALGFLAKQKECVWAVLYLVYLLLAGRTPARRILLFAVGTFGLVAGAVGICAGVWGEPFVFWSFKVLSSLHIGLNLVLYQLSEAAWFIVTGLAAGVLLLRGENFRSLFPVWFCWLLMVIAAIYTSGIAFRPAHLGPASLIGSALFLVGLAAIWPEARVQSADPPAHQLWKMSLACASVLLLIISTGMLRINRFRPDTGSTQVMTPPGIHRYIAEIEKEFEGLPRERVLLDSGSWVYLRENVVMKDRESPIGTLWGTESSDFASTIARIRGYAYTKILARKTPTGEFLLRGKGIQQALRDHYEEARVIRSPGVPPAWLYPPLLYDISVLVPRSRPAGE
jgi:hypothetical protein